MTALRGRWGHYAFVLFLSSFFLLSSFFSSPNHSGRRLDAYHTSTHEDIMLLSCFFLLSVSFLLFFPRLITAVADWMPTILPHMVWPLCEFRMQVWNVLHAARWNTGRKKSPKNRHLRTITQLCRAVASQLRHVSTMEKILKQQYLLHMSS